MIINISDEWRINTDAHQYILQRLPPPNPDKPRNVDQWKSEAYCKTLGQAFEVLTARQIFAIPVEVPSDAAEAALVALIVATEAIRADIQNGLQAASGAGDEYWNGPRH
jgi:hypothetical protein